MSHTEHLLQEIRKMPLFQQVIPMEAGVGFPIPIRRNSKVYAKFLFFGQKATGKPGEWSLTPPFAAITFDWSSYIPVEYINFHFQNPAPELDWHGQAGIFPHDAIKQQMNPAEYKQKRQELLVMYDSLFQALATGKSRTKAQDKEFSQLFSLLIEQPLIPYYQAIGKKFIDRFLVQ